LTIRLSGQIALWRQKCIFHTFIPMLNDIIFQVPSLYVTIIFAIYVTPN